MFIANDKVFVVDSGNNCVKRFNLSGQWEYTYTSSNLTTGDIENGAPISGTLDSDNNLYVVTKDNIVKFDYNGNELYSKPIQFKTGVPVSVRHNRGFLYILTTEEVVRVFGVSGESTNTFALRSQRPVLNQYKKIHVDISNNVYITDGTIILKYVDSPILLDATPRDNPRTWTFDEMKVDPNEFVSSITYNKFFNRMYDNLKVLFHTIEQKVIRNSDNTLAIAQLENCDVGAFDGLPIDKNEIYVGLNEFVVPEVVNRCINQTLILQQYLLDLIMNKYSGCITGDRASYSITLPELPDCCWSWSFRRTALCCLTWSRLRATGTLWSEATSCCVSSY